MNAQDFADIATATAGFVAGVVASIVPLLAAAAPLWMPLLSARIRDEKQRQAFDVVSNACLLALNAAAQDYRKSIEQGGGKTALPEDVRRALAVGGSTGVSWLRDHKVLEQAATVYGGGDQQRGEDAIRLAFESFIRAKLDLSASSDVVVASAPSVVVTTTSAPVVA